MMLSHRSQITHSARVSACDSARDAHAHSARDIIPISRASHSCISVRKPLQGQDFGTNTVLARVEYPTLSRYDDAQCDR